MQPAPKFLPATKDASDSLEVHLLACVDFESALFLQERSVYEISGREDRQGNLLLCEHPPMITVGREGSRAHFRVDPDELTARQMPVRWINRGGGAVVHAPGQLAVYPIVPLNRLGLGVADYRRLLESVALDVCRELAVAAWRRDDLPGVWSPLGQLVSIGVAVKSWVAYHGMFINVSPALEVLRMVDSGTGSSTSLQAQRQRITPMHVVRESVIRNLTDRLGYERHHVYTGHPLLQRTHKKVYVPA